MAKRDKRQQKYKNKRFRQMDKMAKKLEAEFVILEKILEKLEVFSDKSLSNYTLNYFKSKIIGQKPLRAYFCRAIFDYLQNTQNEQNEEEDQKLKELFYIKLPFIFEMVIVIQYLHNHILDEKFEVRRHHHKKVIDNLLSSNILRELLFRYLHQELEPLLPNSKLTFEIHQELSQLLLYVDLGQRIEKDYNHYINWFKSDEYPELLANRNLFKPFVRDCIDSYIGYVKNEVNNRHSFIEAYFQRIYLTNVYFFECITLVVMKLMVYEGPEKVKIQQFAIQYGFMLQIINDYADFAYSPDEKEQEHLKTASKKTTDIFADLYNFNFTLPLIFHWEEGARRKIEAYLQGGIKRKKILTQFPTQIVNEIKLSGGIDKCIHLSRQLSLAARKCLNPENPMFPFLDNMCDMAMDNKFYKLFE